LLFTREIDSLSMDFFYSIFLIKTDVNQLEKEMKRKEESRKIFFPNVN